MYDPVHTYQETFGSRTSGHRSKRAVFVQPKKGYFEPHVEISIPKELKQPMLAHLGGIHGIKAEEIYKDPMFGYIQQQDSTGDTPLRLHSFNSGSKRISAGAWTNFTPWNSYKRSPRDMFRGALSVLEDENNPDRIAQAAHSLREILYPIMSRRIRTSTGTRGRSL